MIQTPKRIALVVEATSSHGRGVLAGVAEYARGHEPWIFLLPVGLAPQMIDRLNVMACDGIIAQLRDPQTVAAIAQLDRPTVNIADDIEVESHPQIGYNSEAAGAVAAEHLIERGIEHFAFVGPKGVRYVDRRLAGFTDAVAQAGGEVHAYRDVSPDGDATYVELTPLARWLVGLPKPVGLFACDDERGFETLQAARLAPLRVPDEVVIVGCGNDTLLARLAHPALSSVKMPHRQVGFEAAKLLHAMLRGEPPTQQIFELDPMGVEARQSSDLMAVPDADVAAAMRYIRDHADLPMQVTDILDVVHISRRSLERRFRQHIGKSPQQEIQRLHIERAKILLAETDLAMPEVAKGSGYRNADRLAAVFRQETGTTPSQYRRRYRRR